MKTLIVALTLMLTSGFAQATAELPRDQSAFLKNRTVQNAIRKARRAGWSLVGGTQSVVLASQCGIAGCDTTSLVTITAKRYGPNPTSEAIAALVTVRIPENVPPVVRVVSVDDLLVLGNK